MFTIVILVMSVVIAVVFFILWNERNEFDNLIAVIASISVGLIVTFCSGTYSVEDYESIILTKFGQVYGQVSSPGLHFKRPWASIVRWDTRLLMIGKSIDVRTEDDISAAISLTIWWKIQKDNLELLYTTVAKDCDYLREGYVLPELESAVMGEAAKISYGDLYTSREKYASTIKMFLSEKLSSRYITVDRIVIKEIIPYAE